LLKVLTIIGTRPEAIKLAPVIQELNRCGDQVRSVVCVTAQHREMLDQILDLFAIRTDYDLDLMQPDQDLTQLTANLLEGLSPVVDEVKPDWILAQGDTTTVLAAALIAFYSKILFGHVEAGLRTGDLNQPFPEEFNRRVADSVASLLFAPTEQNRRILLGEGVPDERILVTGNTVVDALMEISAQPTDPTSPALFDLPNDRELVLITAHRRESFGPQLREICFAVRELALRFENAGVHFVYPVHLNPNVRRPVSEILSGILNVSLIDPVDYKTMVQIMERSILILTDSGGIQEEAPSLRVPVLVMRQSTERPEGVEAGVVRLVGTDRATIVAAASYLIENPPARAEMASGVNPYGDGKAAGRIVAALLDHANRNQPNTSSSMTLETALVVS
jgi:UDP-N-acetylglucosamine 2-epimerase (non-hydrolysing)